MPAMKPKGMAPRPQPQPGQRRERRMLLLQALSLVPLLRAVPASAAPDLQALTREVEATERAFALSMELRDHAAFTALLADDAVFFGSARRVHRGKAAVAAAWRGFFEGPDAPFSWEPDQVEVLADGTLALSTGPVHDPKGRQIARFNSIWRQESPGRWRVVFDKGQPPP